MATDWEANLRTLIKNTEKDADFLRRGSSWKVRGVRGKTQVTMRLQEGLGESNPRSSSMLDIEWKKGNTMQILNAIEDLKRLVNERNLSLSEAKNLLFAPVNQVDSSGENWEALKASYLESKSDRRSTTLKDISTRLNNLLITLEKNPKPRTGRDAMRAYSKHWLKKAPQGGQGRKRSLQDVASFLRFAVTRCGKEERWLPLNAEELRELVGVRQTTSESHLTAAVLPKDLANLLDQMKADGREDLYLATALISLYGLRLGELAKLNIIDGDLFVGHIKQNSQTLIQEEKPPREVLGVDIAGREGEAVKVLQLYQSGLVKLPIAVLNQIKMVEQKGHFKDVGTSFSGILKRYKPWISLVQRNKGVSPYSLRHSWAYRVHKATEAPVDSSIAASLMGHSIEVHNRVYSTWIDKKIKKAAIARANKALIKA